MELVIGFALILFFLWRFNSSKRCPKCHLVRPTARNKEVCDSCFIEQPIRCDMCGLRLMFEGAKCGSCARAALIQQTKNVASKAELDWSLFLLPMHKFLSTSEGLCLFSENAERPLGEEILRLYKQRDEGLIGDNELSELFELVSKQIGHSDPKLLQELVIQLDKIALQHSNRCLSETSISALRNHLKALCADSTLKYCESDELESSLDGWWDARS